MLSKYLNFFCAQAVRNECVGSPTIATIRYYLLYDKWSWNKEVLETLVFVLSLIRKHGQGSFGSFVGWDCPNDPVRRVILSGRSIAPRND